MSARKLEAVTPALLSDADAAAYRGVSLSKNRQDRFRDTRLIREGKEPKGPPWVTIGTSIFYKVTDLDAWIASAAVERGVVEFRGRKPAAQPDEG